MIPPKSRIHPNALAIHQISMRKTVFLACSICLFSSLTGCQIIQRFRSPPIAAPVVYETQPTLDQMLLTLNQQAAAVQQVRAEVRVGMNGIPGRLKGTLMIERPKKLRLKAGLLGVSEMGVDVGSNDELFWVWSRASIPGQQPALFYATHREYQHSRLRSAIPIEPTWLIDALGFVEFSPEDRHEGPFQEKNGLYKIVTYLESGPQPTVRVSTIDPKYGWIAQQTIYDQNGKRIAYVNSTGHKFYPEHNVSLPQKIEIFVDQPNNKPVKLTVNADEFSINSIYGDPNQLWAIPNPPGIPKIDLTQVSNQQSPTIHSGASTLPNSGTRIGY